MNNIDVWRDNMEFNGYHIKPEYISDIKELQEAYPNKEVLSVSRLCWQELSREVGYGKENVRMFFTTKNGSSKCLDFGKYIITFGYD